MARKKKVAEKPRARRLVEDRDIRIGVRGWPGFDDEKPVSEIELAPIGDQKSGHDDVRSREGLGADQFLPGGDVALLPSCDGFREVLVRHKARVRRGEGGVP